VTGGPARSLAAFGCAALLGSAAAPADEGAASPRFADGAALFAANCAVCHRANGAGQSGLAPPLTNYPARFIVLPEGRRQLVMTLLYGMFGDIVVDERHFNFKMPDFARLDDPTLAATINYVVFDLGKAPSSAAPIQPEEVARERSLALSGDAVRRHRAQALDLAPP
jgi:mono/diheme cytochrome c family protein